MQKLQTKFKAALISSTLAIASVVPWVVSTPNTVMANNGELCANDLSTLAQEAEQVGGEKSLHSRSYYIASAKAKQVDEGLFWNTLTKSWLTDEQIALLMMAYEVGYADGGREHAELMQGVLLQETIAGQLGRIGHLSARVGKRSYGVMQVKVTAARDVLRKHKDDFGRFRTDEELIIGLMTDDEFNMRIASRFLLMLDKKTKTVEQTLVAYNIGLRGSRKIPDHANFKYVVRVNRKLESVIRPFNNKFIEGTQTGNNVVALN